MLNRRGFGGAAALLTAVILIPLLPSSEAAGFTYAYIRGHVYDMRGNPLHQALVSTTTEETYTEADGSYELKVDQPACWPVSASHTKPYGAYFGSDTRWICTWLGDAEGEDFRVPYYIYGDATPTFLNSLQDRVVTQTALIYCPPEFCSPQVHVYRLPLGEDPYGKEGEFVGTFLLQFDKTDQDGYSHYKSDIPIPAGTPEGQYRVVRESRNPETGELQTRCMWDRCWNWFVIDNTAPRLGLGSPEAWSNTAEPLIRIPFEDEYPVGISTKSLVFKLDGRQLERSEYSFDGLPWKGAVFHQATGLSDGNHTVSLTLTDRAGNSALTEFSFVIDTLTPGATDASPTGTITTPTPTISAELTDGGNPGTIDPSSIRLLISKGALTNEVEAAFDPGSGIVSYDVPQHVEGVGLGEFPLMDGTYVVSLHFSDLAGNTGLLSWHFTVRYWLP